MTAEDFLNQYDNSNKNVVRSGNASSAESFLDQYDPSIKKPSGTSFGKEVSQLGSAFVESIGRPLENMGESFESFGFNGVANALKGAITEPENYVSAGQRFMEPAPDEAQFMGFAWQYAPRAAVEQVGQAIGAIGTRAVGAAAGGAVAGPPGAIAGGFVGPAIFGAAQVIGPVAKERAKNNGREVPNNSDLVAATLTAIGSGSLDAIGARYLPGGDKATGKFFKRVASSFVGEGVLTETPQSFIEQIGSTAGTEKGLNINVKQAVGEGLIGGTSAAGLTAIVSPLSNPTENQVIRTPEQVEELDINSKSNQEAILLMGDPADQTQNERITKLKEIESVIANNETLMSGLEPNAPERTKLDLENRVAIKEAERLKAEITQGAGLSEPITTIEEQQAALAKTITTPEAAPAPVEQVVTPPVEVAPLPQRTVEESIQNKDTFQYEGMRGAVTLEDGVTVFRPFGTNDKYEVPINPNQSISEIEGIQWLRKGQTRQAPVEPTIPEVAAIVESQPQITEAELNATEDDFQVPQGLIEIEKSPTLNAIADIFNTGESKIVKDGKRSKKVSDTPEFYSQITPQQIDIANRQIDNALRIIDNLLISDEQKQALAEPYLLIDQDISSYENNPKYQQYKASISREVRAADKAVAFPETISEVAAKVKELEQRAAKPAVEPVTDQVTQPAAPTPAVSETITEPEGIAVGNRIKLGKSPQTYTVEEVIPQTESEKANNEQFYSVKNERTGEVQTVEAKDLKKVGGKKVRKAAAGVIPKQESVSPTPEKDRYTFEQVVKAADKYFGKMIPEGFVIVNDTELKELQYKAGYDPKTGQIILNLAYINNNESIDDLISHELGHYIFSDKEFQEDFKNFWNMMSAEEKAGLDNIIKQFYNKETGAVQIEEKQVRAFMQLVSEANAQPEWKKLLDKIKNWINNIFGTNLQVTDRGALAVLAAAHKRFKSGEQIVREIDSGTLKVAADREKVMGAAVGPEKKTPEGIIAKTQELLRNQFDPAKVSDKNTTEAFRALGRLMGKDGTSFAQELNDIGRVVDESGAASEISMGAALFVNDLFEYAIRLAANGDKKMLGMMMSNINKLPTAAIGASDAARTLRARLELSQRFLTMAQAEQDAYTNYVAEFIYGPNPSKEQIQSIKDAYAAVEKIPQLTEQELTDEIKAVGDRTGTDLVGKINEEFTKATEKGREKRKSELEELDKEYKKVQNQADAEIEKLAKIQSDTPSFDPVKARQTANDVRAIVADDLKQRPDMGRKVPWKSMLVAKLQEAGVELTAAETLADIVWRQHEINNLSRELASINKAIEKGPISEIVKAIKETPLEEQQNPNWRYEVMRDYLRRAGLNVAQSERIAKLMDISLQKRFTMAQEQAFTDAISKTAPWKSGDTRSRRAFQKVLQALRAGALDPARNVLSDMAALNGWTGFTPDQYKTLLKNDAILSDPESADATKAEAHKAIQDIISKAKLPIRARDVIGQYYDAQALSGIPTVTVNIFSPAGVAVKNALTQSLNGVLTARPEQITASLTTFIDSIKSWANTVAYSFKNNVTVYSNVEYLVNDEGLLKLYKKGVDQFTKGKTPRDKVDGVKNMMIGMMDYVRRILNALDYGAIASLQNQSVSKYALAAMQAKGMSSKDGAKMLNAMMEQKRIFYNKQIANKVDKNKAAVLADEFFISSWRQALTDAKLPAQQVMDAALNDSMSAVGRNRQSLDAFREEETDIRDNGVTSFPAIWLLETMANAANKQDSQFIKIFSRVIYGFAVVPARVLRETAWFSPYGAVRFAYDSIAKKMGRKSPYAQSLGNDLQYRQRLTETIAGSLVMLAFGAAMSASTEDEEDEKPFKIVVTGNGPLRSEDPQYYDSWTKKNKANTVNVYFGKTKFTINTMRGFEAFAWPAMMLGAVDDWNIRRKQKRETNTPAQMGDAAIIGGFIFSASLRRGPYAFAAKPLFEAYGDRGVESLAKNLAFPAKTLVPVLGSSLAKNLSDFLNEPVDRKTLEGALWANVPFIGPAVSPKSLNAFGEPALANEAADKIFKLGVPITFNIPNDRESVMLHELVLKQGGGPSIPTRNQLAQRLDRQPTNKEYEMFVKEYGAILTKSMKSNYDRLSAMKPELYSKTIERIGNNARDVAERKVRIESRNP